MADFLSGVANSFVSQLATGDEIHDWQHASRTFIDSLYRLSPKIGTVYHVFIDLNPTIASIDQSNQIEIGLMAKSVQLPKFSIQSKTLNAYNRKNIVQERINYDPLSIVFHDDSADVVRDFWYGYYSYYYRDADHQEAIYESEHKYKKRQEQNWGFSPNPGSVVGTPGYINSIRVYSLHQKIFSSYQLMRPTITSFQHGQHVSGDYTPMEHTMTVAYEAVKYAAGTVSNGTVLGFNVIHYDNTPSPLSSLGGGTTSVLGPGGLIQGLTGVVKNLEDGNFLGAALGGLRTAQNFKNTSLKGIASTELQTAAKNILRGQNPLSTIFVPTASTVNQGLGRSVYSTPGYFPGNNLNAQNTQLPSSNQGIPGN